MKKILSIVTLVLALIVTADTAYATNSYATPDGNGTYTGHIYGTISQSLDSWMELDMGSGYQAYNRSVKPAGEISATVPGLTCGKSYPYRTAALWNGQTLYGQVFQLTVNCANTGGTGGNYVSVTTDSANAAQTTATMYATVSGSANSWIEINLGNGNIYRAGQATHNGSFSGYVSGLTCSTRYQYRAVAETASGLVYGATKSFDTDACYNGGNGGGTNTNYYINTDNASASQYAATLYASTNNNQVDTWIEVNLGNGNIRQLGRGTHSGSFTGYISGLNCSTRYQYRAVASTNQGLVYGAVKSFDTAACNNGGGNQNNNLSVITTGATGVGYTSARLNGLALVNGTTPSTGWFEYGTSANLGSRTAARTYYESNTATLVDSISGLQTDTTYYYRAVAQNANGIAYGDIKSFRTATLSSGSNNNTNTTTIIRNTTTNTRTTTGTTAVNSGIVYIPVQLAQIGSVGTVNGTGPIGQPALATTQVVKAGADGCDNTFTITYTNISDKTLNNVIGTVMLPNELAFVNATDGTFRETDNTLSINIGTLGARESRTITVTTSVLKGAQVGKQVAVTAHLNYTDGTSTAQDQVTGYAILTVGDNCTLTVNGTSQAGAAGLFSFLPNTLWEWILVIFAIALIIFAARSLFASKDGAAH